MARTKPRTRSSAKAVPLLVQSGRAQKKALPKLPVRLECSGNCKTRFFVRSLTRMASKNERSGKRKAEEIAPEKEDTRIAKLPKLRRGDSIAAEPPVFGRFPQEKLVYSDEPYDQSLVSSEAAGSDCSWKKPCNLNRKFFEARDSFTPVRPRSGILNEYYRRNIRLSRERRSLSSPSESIYQSLPPPSEVARNRGDVGAEDECLVLDGVDLSLNVDLAIQLQPHIRFQEVWNELKRLRAAKYTEDYLSTPRFHADEPVIIHCAPFFRHAKVVKYCGAKKCKKMLTRVPRYKVNCSGEIEMKHEWEIMRKSGPVRSHGALFAHYWNQWEKWALYRKAGRLYFMSSQKISEHEAFWKSDVAAVEHDGSSFSDHVQFKLPTPPRRQF